MLKFFNNLLYSKDTMLLHAAKTNNLTDFKEYLERGANIEVEDKLDENRDTKRPIHYACINGNIGMINLLATRGALLSSPSSLMAKTPLHLAIQSGHFNVVQRLVELNVELNLLDSYGHTPLCTAVEKYLLFKKENYKNMVKVLVGSGAHEDVVETLFLHKKKITHGAEHYSRSKKNIQLLWEELFERKFNNDFGEALDNKVSSSEVQSYRNDFGDAQDNKVSSTMFQSYRVFLKDLEGGMSMYRIDNSQRVGDFKDKIKIKLGIPVDQQRLIFAGRQLEADSTLEESNIKNDSTVHLVTRIRGD